MTENNNDVSTLPEMKLELVPMPVSDVDRAKAGDPHHRHRIPSVKA